MAISRAKTYNIGRLKRLAELQAYTTASDGMGGSFATWGKVADVYCDIMPLSGRELLEFGAVTANVSHRIIMRYRANLTPDNRLVWDSRYFNIKSVLNLDEESKIIEMLAVEEVQNVQSS
jgi:SPP1 family predicted phage head-tail adaptor